MSAGNGADVADPREDGRDERRAELLEQIEGAFDDADTLGLLRQHVRVAELDEDDRDALLTNIEQYLSDLALEHSIREQRGRGDLHGDPQEFPAPTVGDPDPGDPGDDDDLVGTEWAPL